MWTHTSKLNSTFGTFRGLRPGGKRSDGWISVHEDPSSNPTGPWYLFLLLSLFCPKLHSLTWIILTKTSNAAPSSWYLTSIKKEKSPSIQRYLNPRPVIFRLADWRTYRCAADWSVWTVIEKLLEGWILVQNDPSLNPIWTWPIFLLLSLFCHKAQLTMNLFTKGRASTRIRTQLSDL